MINFKSALASRIHNFAIKVEKISKDSMKTTDKDLDKLEVLAELQGSIEDTMNQLFEQTKEAEALLKNINQGEKKRG